MSKHFPPPLTKGCLLSESDIREKVVGRGDEAIVCVSVRSVPLIVLCIGPSEAATSCIPSARRPLPRLVLPPSLLRKLHKLNPLTPHSCFQTPLPHFSALKSCLTAFEEKTWSVGIGAPARRALFPPKLKAYSAVHTHTQPQL